MGRGIRQGAIVAAAVVAITVSGCEDIRGFEGQWQGAVSADPSLGKGFARGDVVAISIESVTRDRIGMALVLPGASEPTRFSPIRSASADALGELRLPGEPLRTFLGYVDAPAGGTPYLAIVSLYAEKRVELRLIRGADESYGVFTLLR